jgi:hypothetical protein
MKSAFAMGIASPLAAFGLTVAAASAHAAGTVILEGSDAIGYHCPIGESGACAYANQTWSALGGSSPLPIAVVGTDVNGEAGAEPSMTHPTEDFFTLASAGALSQYAAIYFVSGDGCCSSDPADMAGRQADVAAYVDAGGTVEIENYDGNTGWDFLTGGAGTNNAFVAGINGSLAGPNCTDLESVTALGMVNGFTQPPVIHCWTHQAYSEPHFAALGFTESFYDADPAFAADNPGYGAFSSLLSDGDTLTGRGAATPEPGSWALMLVGVGAVGMALRRRLSSKSALRCTGRS